MAGPGLAACRRAVIAATFLGARSVVGQLRAQCAPAATPRRQLAVVVIALVLGGGAALGLAEAELHLRPSPTYAAIMKTEGQRAVDREVARARAARPRATEAELAAVRRAASSRHRGFPFAPVLIGLIADRRGRRGRPVAAGGRPRGPALARLAGPVAVGAAGVDLVAAIATLA